jgi:CBS domain-containing protein
VTAAASGSRAEGLTPTVFTVTPVTSVYEAACLMVSRRIGAVVVDARAVPVQAVMSAPVITVPQHAEVDMAIALMRLRSCAVMAFGEYRSRGFPLRRRGFGPSACAHSPSLPPQARGLETFHGMRSHVKDITNLASIMSHPTGSDRDPAAGLASAGSSFGSPLTETCATLVISSRL